MQTKPLSYLFIGSIFVSIMSMNCQVLAEDFAARSPTEDEVIQALDPPKMRGIRPGAAAKAMARPSISMELQFDFNSSAVSPTDEERLNTVAQALNADRLSIKIFEVIGHTDAKGSSQYNKRLSERRAAAVVGYLVKQGVNENRLMIVGKGESELKNKADSEAAENRRVEIAVAR